MHLWLSVYKVSKLHNKQTHKRRIAKCDCCNKRLKKVVTYECWTDDCEEHVLFADTYRPPADLYSEEQEGED